MFSSQRKYVSLILLMIKSRRYVICCIKFDGCKLQHRRNCSRHIIAIKRRWLRLLLWTIYVIDARRNLHFISVRLKWKVTTAPTRRQRIKRRDSVSDQRDESTVNNEWTGISNQNRNSRLACGAGWHTELEVTFPVPWPRSSHRSATATIVHDRRRSINWTRKPSRAVARPDGSSTGNGIGRHQATVGFRRVVGSRWCPPHGTCTMAGTRVGERLVRERFGRTRISFPPWPTIGGNALYLLENKGGSVAG